MAESGSLHLAVDLPLRSGAIFFSLQSSSLFSLRCGAIGGVGSVGRPIIVDCRVLSFLMGQREPLRDDRSAQVEQ